MANSVKVSQPMAAKGSSPFASGVPAKPASEVIPSGDACIRGGDKPPISSLLDKQEGVGNSISFVVPAVPKGKARHSTVITLRCGQCQRMIMGQRKECPHCMNRQLYFSHSSEYTPREQKEAEQFIALCGQQAMRGREKFSGPTRIDCKFFFGIPKTRAKKLLDGGWHTQRPDTDNCVKSVWDAMNQVCFADDCIVVQMTAEKRWTTGCPRTEVSISLLAEAEATL